MTNAEWMIKNRYKFTDLLITYSDDSVYKISVCGKPITEYKATNEITYLEVILKWLDMEHEGGGQQLMKRSTNGSLEECTNCQP